MTAIEYLRLKNRTYNTLLHNGIETVEQAKSLLAQFDSCRKHLRMIGETSEMEIRKAIAAFQTKA